MTDQSTASALQPRKTPKQKRAQDRRDLILATTADLIVEVGFDALNTRQIAAACEIGPSSLYQYFPNKHAIVTEIARTSEAMSRDYLQRDLAAVGQAGQWRQMIDRFVEETMASYINDPRAAAIYRALRADPALQQVDAELNEGYARAIAEMLKTAGATGGRGQLLVVGRLITAMTDAVINQAIDMDRQGGKALTAELKHALQRYLAPMF